MNYRQLFFVVCVGAAMAVTVRATDPTATPTPEPGGPHKKATPTPAPGQPLHPGVFNRIYHTLHLSEDKTEAAKKQEEGKMTHWKHLALAMAIDPLPVKLSEVHQFRVTLKLENPSKNFVQLEFPTSQRIEVLVKNAEGKLLEHWSEDQAFTNEPSIVSVNPGERLEFSANVATRELKSGEKYTIEGFFPNYEALHATTDIIPAP